MQTVIKDTPAMNIREEAQIISLQISPTMVYADIRVTISDLTAHRVLGMRVPVLPPGPNGLPQPGGIPVSSLPQPQQNAINNLAHHILTQPYVLP